MIYSTRPASCLQSQNPTRPKNHVLKSGLHSFPIGTSYNVHVMSNPIKDRKIQFCGVNTLFSNFLFFYLLIIIIIIIYKFISLFVFFAYLSLIFLSEFGRGYEWSPKYVVCHQGDAVKVRKEGK